MPDLKIHSQKANLAGEFAVLSQLAMQDLVGTFTLGNTKGVDILVLNPTTGKQFRLEVKTALERTPNKSKLFENQEPHYDWRMDIKHEIIPKEHESFFYGFVWIDNPQAKPLFFIVPSKEVAEYITWENDHWWDNPHKEKKTGATRTKDNFKNREDRPSQRLFRINVKTNGNERFPRRNYLNNWSVFK